MAAAPHRFPARSGPLQTLAFGLGTAVLCTAKYMTVKLISGRLRESDMANADSALSWTVTPAVTAVGILAVLHDSWPAHAPNAGAAIHALFAAALWLSAAAPLALRLRRSSFVHSADVNAYVRRLSRTTYLVLYVLAGTKEMAALAAAGAASGPAIEDCMKGLQCYLIYGCCTLLTIRAMAARWRWRWRWRESNSGGARSSGIVNHRPDPAVLPALARCGKGIP